MCQLPVIELTISSSKSRLTWWSSLDAKRIRLLSFSGSIRRTILASTAVWRSVTVSFICVCCGMVATCTWSSPTSLYHTSIWFSMVWKEREERRGEPDSGEREQGTNDHIEWMKRGKHGMTTSNRTSINSVEEDENMEDGIWITYVSTFLTCKKFEISKSMDRQAVEGSLLYPLPRWMLGGGVRKMW